MVSGTEDRSAGKCEGEECDYDRRIGRRRVANPTRTRYLAIPAEPAGSAEARAWEDDLIGGDRAWPRQRLEDGQRQRSCSAGQRYFRVPREGSWPMYAMRWQITGSLSMS